MNLGSVERTTYGFESASEGIGALMLMMLMFIGLCLLAISRGPSSAGGTGVVPSPTALSSPETSPASHVGLVIVVPTARLPEFQHLLGAEETLRADLGETSRDAVLIGTQNAEEAQSIAEALRRDNQLVDGPSHEVVVVP